ncbi:Hypothetical protein POVR1_LOCUS482 [uncultured virus]|nr:Hypothetical protein POVR1_LOCUS482 [uncultured virus]
MIGNYDDQGDYILKIKIELSRWLSSEWNLDLDSEIEELPAQSSVLQRLNLFIRANKK